MFCFLLQALYFVLFENIYENDEEKFEVDPFEQAMMAGKIMSNDIIIEGCGAILFVRNFFLMVLSFGKYQAELWSERKW